MSSSSSAGGGSKVEVLWSPNAERDFATHSTELRVYSLRDSQDGSHGDLALGAGRFGRLTTALNSEIHCMPVHQCVAWRPSTQQPYFFAVGHSSGKALLTNLGLDQQSVPMANQILVPRNGRPCTCLTWNPTETHLLAVGLDKAKYDSSLIVWDITRAASSSESNQPTERPSSRLTSGFRFGSEQGAASEDSSKAKHFDIGHGESTSSIAWLPSQPNCLVAGMGTRFLRLFDTRDNPTSQGHAPGPREAANHKAINGLCVDPNSAHQLATYGEGGTVYVWDIRQFGRPAYSFSRSGSVIRLAWAPTRSGCLSVLLSEPPYLHLVDLPSFTQSPDAPVDIGELYIDQLTSDRCPYFTADKGDPYPKLNAIGWHTKWENTCLIADCEGGVRELHVFDKMPLSWKANDLLYGSSQHLFSATLAELEEEDVSRQMKTRVNLGYGFEPETNAKLLSGYPQLQDVWKWLQMHRDLHSQGLLSLDKPKRSISGVATVLSVEKHDDEPPSLSKRVSWHDREGLLPAELPPFPVFRSSERQTALLLCGWGFSDRQTLEDFIKRLELSENYERATAIAVFQGHVRRGIASLKDGASVAIRSNNTARGNMLNLIALALSGYTPQETKLWHETCSGIKSNIANPYLRAVFNFLCGTGRDGFPAVLKETEMSLQDRVAFACTYLDDGQLQHYLSQLTQGVVKCGRIGGLFLTGLGSEGITLLTNYVDIVGDVQTACFVAGQVMPVATKLKVVQAWFKGYRDLLDQWQLWHQRALFDSHWRRLDQTFKPQRQAFVMCSFCSKSIASDTLRQDRRSAYPSSSSASRKTTSCPNCRKPLPRCALCLLNMVATGTKLNRDTGASQPGAGEQFGKWFTWCQTCRHGGHAQHITEWFSSHQECPVAGCSCHCFALDHGIC